MLHTSPHTIRYYLLLFIFLFLGSAPLISQDDLATFSENTGIHLGMDVTLEIGIGFITKGKHSKKEKIPLGEQALPWTINLRTSFGVRYDGKIDWSNNNDQITYFSPMYHLGFGLTRGRGALGHSGSFKERKTFQFEMVHSFHLVASLDKKYSDPNDLKPFQFFTSNHGSPLDINYKHYFGLGTVIIQNPDPARFVQRSGSIAFSFGDVSVFYTNDGGPVHGDLGLGDQWDRYWNGGLAVYYKNLNQPQFPWQMMLSFDRFTGYTKNAYKLGQLLKMDYVSYGREQAFNKGHWKFRAYNTDHGQGFFLALTDWDDLDLQHMLHTGLGIPWHPTYYSYGIQGGLIYKN